MDVHNIEILDEEFGAVSRLYLYALLPLFGEQQEKTLDEEGMKAYKSLKAYFADSYIRNVWAGAPQERDDAVVVRCHCFSSMKVKKVYVVHLVKKSGDVHSASCTCVAGKGEACSHIPALICMFYLKDFMRQGHSDLPTNTAATNHLQQWHVPPKHDVFAQPMVGIVFRKTEYGKVVCTSFGHHYCLCPSNAKSNHDHAQAQTAISAVCAVLPSSGLTYFWDTAGNLQL